MLGVDPPRPLPPAAYDLQTALESVQHFATQTLAGVVQAKAAAKESREAAAAAGSLEGWEKAWPPKELTKELGLVTARQMAHVMRCDAEPLIQVCTVFDPFFLLLFCHFFFSSSIHNAGLAAQQQDDAKLYTHNSAACMHPPLQWFRRCRVHYYHCAAA